MRNLRSFLAIILGLFGIAALSSCGKSVTCECLLEDSNDVKVYIDIEKGKCKDVSGKVSYGGYSYDIYNCDE